jgi:hypothetical protein
MTEYCIDIMDIGFPRHLGEIMPVQKRSQEYKKKEDASFPNEIALGQHQSRLSSIRASNQ